MTVQLQKQRSKIFDQLLNALNLDFDKLQLKVVAVFSQGRKEGFTDMEIGELVRSKMKGHYTDRTIQRVLPETAKHREHTSSKHRTEPDKMSGSEREPIEVPADKVKVEGIENELSNNSNNVESKSIELPNNDWLYNRIDVLKRENAQLKTQLQLPIDNSDEQKIPATAAPEEREIIDDAREKLKTIEQEHQDAISTAKLIHDQEVEIIELKKENTLLKKENTDLKAYIKNLRKDTRNRTAGPGYQATNPADDSTAINPDAQNHE